MAMSEYRPPSWQALQALFFLYYGRISSCWSSISHFELPFLLLATRLLICVHFLIGVHMNMPCKYLVVFQHSPMFVLAESLRHWCFCPTWAGTIAWAVVELALCSAFLVYLRLRLPWKNCDRSIHLLFTSSVLLPPPLASFIRFSTR